MRNLLTEQMIWVSVISQVLEIYQWTERQGLFFNACVEYGMRVERAATDNKQIKYIKHADGEKYCGKNKMEKRDREWKNIYI